MKKHLIALGLLTALTATEAIADTQHYATASTKKDAKRLATAEARAEAQASSLCFRPARQVRACQQVEGGFRCRADTSDNSLTCRRAGWVNAYTPDTYAKLSWQRNLWTTSWPIEPQSRPIPIEQRFIQTGTTVP